MHKLERKGWFWGLDRGVGGSKGKSIHLSAQSGSSEVMINSAGIQSVSISISKKWTTFPSLSWPRACLMIQYISSAILGHQIEVEERSIYSVPLIWQALAWHWGFKGWAKINLDPAFPELSRLREKDPFKDCTTLLWAFVGEAAWAESMTLVFQLYLWWCPANLTQLWTWLWTVEPEPRMKQQ